MMNNLLKEHQQKLAFTHWLQNWNKKKKIFDNVINSADKSIHVQNWRRYFLLYSHAKILLNTFFFFSNVYKMQTHYMIFNTIVIDKILWIIRILLWAFFFFILTLQNCRINHQKRLRSLYSVNIGKYTCPYLETLQRESYIELPTVLFVSYDFDVHKLDLIWRKATVAGDQIRERPAYHCRR